MIGIGLRVLDARDEIDRTMNLAEPFLTFPLIQQAEAQLAVKSRVAWAQFKRTAKVVFGSCNAFFECTTMTGRGVGYGTHVRQTQLRIGVRVWHKYDRSFVGVDRGLVDFKEKVGST